MSRTCYTCGGRGHYKAECPTNKKAVKCYFCNGFGHYQERCHVKFEQQKVFREEAQRNRQLEQQKSDEAWMSEHMPDMNKTIINLDELREFFKKNTNQLNFNLYTDNETFPCFYMYGEINCHQGSTPFSRAIYDMNVETFLSFLSQKGAFKSLSYAIETLDEEMVNVLSNDKIVKESGSGKSCTYSINGRKVMRTSDSRGEYSSSIQNSELIRETYAKYLKTMGVMNVNIKYN